MFRRCHYHNLVILIAFDVRNTKAPEEKDKQANLRKYLCNQFKTEPHGLPGVWAVNEQSANYWKNPPKGKDDFWNSQSIQSFCRYLSLACHRLQIAIVMSNEWTKRRQKMCTTGQQGRRDPGWKNSEAKNRRTRIGKEEGHLISKENLGNTLVLDLFQSAL